MKVRPYSGSKLCVSNAGNEAPQDKQNETKDPKAEWKNTCER